MSFDLVALGNKLQRYRVQLQLSVEDVSAATGIEESVLLRIESGIERPSGDQILIFADFFRCDYKFFISNEKLAPFEQTENLYRRYGLEFSPSDRRSVQDFLFLCENEHFLQGALELPFRPLPAVNLDGKIYKKHGVQAANQVRAYLGYQVNEPPKSEIFQDLRSLGIHVFRRALGNSNISGICIHHPVAGPCLLLNYSDDVYRQRFSAAHEAAHALIDSDEEVVVSLFSGWTHDNLREVRANSFASAFLVPSSVLGGIPQSRQWDGGKIRQWCSNLQVNAQTLAIALRESGLITIEQQQNFKTISLPRSSKIDPELPDDLSPLSRERKLTLLRMGLSSRYVHLCFEAYERGIISSGRLSEMLVVDERDLASIAELFGAGLNDGH
jgi:Zn-dependent peptidase ImmA (M78 family)/transcriptional regulator with XRE-family HTH domain